MIKLSILWDEKRLTAMNPEDLSKEIAAIYSEFQKEMAATTTIPNAGSIFIGFATETDSELVKNLLSLPSELRSRLLIYIQSYFKTEAIESENELNTTQAETIVQNEKIKNLLLSFPHKDIEILIDRPIDIGRDVLL